MSHLAGELSQLFFLIRVRVRRVMVGVVSYVTENSSNK